MRPMFRTLTAAMLVLAIGGASAAAQQMTATTPANPLVSGLTNLYNGIEMNVLGAAELMPEHLYGYRPVKDVRSFGEIAAHIADAQKALCLGMQGGNVDLKDELEKSLTTKAAIVGALKDTFAGCRAVITSLSDADAQRLVPFGQDPDAVATLIAFTISHGNEHYGNLVTYMRMNGIVPPSSR
jgi:uncharacterized damage-inducible protein DinB